MKDDSHFSYALSPLLDDPKSSPPKKRPAWLREVIIAGVIILVGIGIGLLVWATKSHQTAKKTTKSTTSTTAKSSNPPSTSSKSADTSEKSTTPTEKKPDAAPTNAATATAATPADDNVAINSIITTSYNQLISSHVADPKLGCSTSPIASYSYSIPAQTANSATAAVALQISGGGSATANVNMTKSGTTWTMGTVTCQ